MLDIKNISCCVQKYLGRKFWQIEVIRKALSQYFEVINHFGIENCETSAGHTDNSNSAFFHYFILNALKSNS